MDNQKYEKFAWMGFGALLAMYSLRTIGLKDKIIRTANDCWKLDDYIKLTHRLLSFHNSVASKLGITNIYYHTIINRIICGNNSGPVYTMLNDVYSTDNPNPHESLYFSRNITAITELTKVIFQQKDYCRTSDKRNKYIDTWLDYVFTKWGVVNTSSPFKAIINNLPDEFKKEFIENVVKRYNEHHGVDQYYSQRVDYLSQKHILFLLTDNLNSEEIQKIVSDILCKDDNNARIISRKYHNSILIKIKNLIETGSVEDSKIIRDICIEHLKNSYEDPKPEKMLKFLKDISPLEDYDILHEQAMEYCNYKLIQSYINSSKYLPDHYLLTLQKNITALNCAPEDINQPIAECKALCTKIKKLDDSEHSKHKLVKELILNQVSTLINDLEGIQIVKDIMTGSSWSVKACAAFFRITNSDSSLWKKNPFLNYIFSHSAFAKADEYNNIVELQKHTSILRDYQNSILDSTQHFEGQRTLIQNYAFAPPKKSAGFSQQLHELDANYEEASFLGETKAIGW
ncbi:MAG: hypothetical protein DGJ47_000502 [Rickettsiaceae bacterium]